MKQQEWFNRPTLPLDECVHGTIYELKSRNLVAGVYNEQSQGFIGIREKFGDRYLFTEYHYDTGAPFGTASPFDVLGVVDLDKIEIREHMEPDCRSTPGRLTEFIPDDPATKVPGKHYHKDDHTVCTEPCMRMYQPLFDLLVPYDKEAGRRYDDM